MKKTVQIALALVMLVALLTNCENDALKPEDTIIPEVATVKATLYEQFYTDYLLYVEKLNNNEKSFVNNFLNARQESQIKFTVNCSCGEGQATCSAAGWFSECCICCGVGLGAVCGVTGGYASCRCEDRNPQPRMHGNEPEYVTLFPKRWAEFVTLARKNNIGDIEQINQSFTKLLSK
jgi:hypothetical protein